MSVEHDLERELSQALSVAPAAGFEARVLRRIERDRGQPRTWSYGRWLAAAAALALVAWLFGQAGSPEAPEAPRVAKPGTARAQQSQPAAIPPAGPSALERGAAAVPSGLERQRRPRLARDAVAVSEPAVIVSGEQLDALHRFLRDMEAGRFIIAEPPVEVSATLEETLIAPVQIELIPIPVLDPTTGKPAPASSESLR